MASEREAPKGLKLYVILGSMYFGVFLGALDGTVVASLLPDIASDLHELGRVAWIATGYLVACAAFQPLYGKISDIYGRKAMLILCNSLFAVGCLICGIAPNLEWLVFGRVVSGMGGGGIMILSTVACSDLVPLRQRGLFQGVGNLCFGAGAGVGGVFGGLVASRWGWRTAFLCQVPAICVSIVLLAVLFKPAEKDESETAPLLGNNVPTIRSKLGRIDFYGSAALVTMLIMLMLALSTGGQQFAWTHPVIPSLLVGSVLMGCLFVYIEMHIAKEPIIPVRLFGNRTIVASSLCNFFSTMSVYTVLFFIPILFSSVQNMNSTQVGEKLIGNFVGVATGSFFAGWYMKHTGKYYTLAVLSPILTLIGVSAALRFDQGTPAWQEYLALAFNGFGYASMLTITLIALIAAVPHEFQAVTTSIQYAFRGIGSTLGVSVASAIFQNTLSAKLHERIPDAPDAIRRVLESVDEIRKVPQQLQPAIIQSYLDSSRAVLTFSLIACVLGVVCSALMREYKLHNTLHRD